MPNAKTQDATFANSGTSKIVRHLSHVTIRNGRLDHISTVTVKA